MAPRPEAYRMVAGRAHDDLALDAHSCASSKAALNTRKWGHSVRGDLSCIYQPQPQPGFLGFSDAENCHDGPYRNLTTP